jgi:hypothetical protein
MVYNYLLDLYKVLAERKKHLVEPGDASFGSIDSGQYHKGRITAIEEFTKFLEKNYHHKLPRRMQKN